jgi:hypothetical protein
MQDQDFKIHSGQIFFHQTENGRNEKNGYLKTIIWQSCWQSTPRDNDQYKGATLCLEEKSIPSRKRDEHFLQQDKGASWFIKSSLILSASDNECF